MWVIAAGCLLGWNVSSQRAAADAGAKCSEPPAVNARLVATEVAPAPQAQTIQLTGGGEATLVQCDVKTWGNQAGATDSGKALVAGVWSSDRTVAEGGTTAVINPLYLDRNAPTGTLQVNAGAARTSSTLVRLNVTTADDQPWGWGAARLRLSTDGSKWTDWQSITGGLDWRLTGAKGEKTVYLQLRDCAGNDSPIISQTILYAPIENATSRKWMLYR